MQSYTQVLSYEGYTPTQFVLLVQLAMKRLQWRVQVNGELEVSGIVPAAGWSWGEVVTVQVYEREAWVTSKYKQWTLPLSDKHKQNIQAFNNAIAYVQTRYQPDVLAQAETDALLLDMDRLNEADPLTGTAASQGTHYAMYGLGIGMIAVYVIMICLGVSPFKPDADTLFSWGSNFGPVVHAGQYWRLFTSLFVHAGLEHLLLNLAALYVAGLFLEPLIGRWSFLLAFLLTGWVASTTSIWWHTNTVSVGASGGVFGLYGVLLALLVTGVAGRQQRANLLGSVILFVVINLLYGLKEGVDNAAHMGGLASGLSLGLLMAGERHWKRLRLLWKTAGMVLPLLITVPYLLVNYQAQAASKPLEQVALVGRLQEIFLLDEAAEWPIASSSDKSANQLAGEVERVSIPKWTELSNILSSYDQVPLDSFNRKLHTLFTDYTKLRLRESALYIQQADDSLNFSPQELAALQEQIEQQKITIAQEMK